MTDPQSLLNPVQRVALAEGRFVEVREMRGIDTLSFLRMLTGHLEKFIDADGHFRLDLTTLAEAVMASEDLALFLVSHATGQDAEWVRGLSTSEFLAVLEAAIALNIREDLKKRAERLGALVSSLFTAGASAKPSAPSPAPSMPSTASATPAPGTTPCAR